MIVDWLSLTLPVEPHENDMIARDAMIEAIQNVSTALYRELWDTGLKPATPRRPYQIAYRNHGVYMYAGVRVPHCLVELSGQGCDHLREIGLLDVVLNYEPAQFTRIDIAWDILGVSPDEIIEEGYADTFRTHSRIASDSGITHYVGSVKSERYARVYRYAPPHERANLCRIETVYRKRYARIMLDSIRRDGLITAGLAGLAAYKFKHSSVPTHEGEVLAARAIVKSDQSTMRWILVQVAPAIKRLVANGTIDNPDEFFREHFLT